MLWSLQAIYGVVTTGGLLNLVIHILPSNVASDTPFRLSVDRFG